MHMLTHPFFFRSLQQAQPVAIRTLNAPTVLRSAQRVRTHCLRAGLFALCTFWASASAAQPGNPTHAESPWLVVPTLSATPKLGSSIGGMAGYTTRLDPGSSYSLFAVTANYSSSHSKTASAFAQAYWNADRDHLMAAAAFGRINNEYEDFLGSGYPFATTDELKALWLRYTMRISGPWHAGAQLVYGTYTINGTDSNGDLILENLGLTGTKSSGLGPVLEYDPRDSKTMPRQGTFAQVSATVFRQGLGGSADYESYSANWRHYTTLNERSVLATRVMATWHTDAPKAAWSSVTLRPYTRGQYLAPGSISAETEWRVRFGSRYGATVFGGIACLQGADQNCGTKLFPMVGAGLQYVFKPEAGRLVNLSVAKGSGSNVALLLKMGYEY